VPPSKKVGDFVTPGSKAAIRFAREQKHRSDGDPSLWAILLATLQNALLLSCSNRLDVIWSRLRAVRDPMPPELAIAGGVALERLLAANGLLNGVDAHGCHRSFAGKNVLSRTTPR